MKQQKPKPDLYSVVIDWDDDEKSFIGRVPAMRGVVAQGDSREAVATELNEMIQLALDVMDEHDDPIPESDAIIDDIQRLLPLINVSKLARAAKVNRNTLVARLRRRAPFPPEDARRLRRVVAKM